MVVVVADGVAVEEAFVFDSDLVGVVVFQQAQPGLAEQADIVGGVPFAESK
jgi:hypothetical protein